MILCEICGDVDGWRITKRKHICDECHFLLFNDGHEDIFYFGSTYQDMLKEYHTNLAMEKMLRGINIFNPFEKYTTQDFFIQKCPGCHNHFPFQVQYCYLCGTKVGILRLHNEVLIELAVMNKKEPR